MFCLLDGDLDLSKFLACYHLTVLCIYHLILCINCTCDYQLNKRQILINKLLLFVALPTSKQPVIAAAFF